MHFFYIILKKYPIKTSDLQDTLKYGESFKPSESIRPRLSNLASKSHLFRNSFKNSQDYKSIEKAEENGTANYGNYGNNNQGGNKLENNGN